MDKYVLLENGIVKQRDCNPREGFIKVRPEVTPGMIDTGAVDAEGYRIFKKPDPTPKTDEQLADDAKQEGLPYNGHQVPFTSTDAVGMLQVKAAFELGVPSTNIKFSNGTIMPIAATEFAVFASWFATERNKFFI